MSTTKMPRKDRQEQRNQERDMPWVWASGIAIAVLICGAAAYYGLR